MCQAANTQTKRTREIKIPTKLAALLERSELPPSDLFSKTDVGYLTQQAAYLALRKALLVVSFDDVTGIAIAQANDPTGLFDLPPLRYQPQ